MDDSRKYAAILGLATAEVDWTRFGACWQLRRCLFVPEERSWKHNTELLSGGDPHISTNARPINRSQNHPTGTGTNVSITPDPEQVPHECRSCRICAAKTIPHWTSKKNETMTPPMFRYSIAYYQRPDLDMIPKAHTPKTPAHTWHMLKTNVSTILHRSCNTLSSLVSA